MFFGTRKTAVKNDFEFMTKYFSKLKQINRAMYSVHRPILF